MSKVNQTLEEILAIKQQKYLKHKQEQEEERKVLETKNLLSKSAILLGQMKHHPTDMREPEVAHMALTDENDPIQEIIEKHK